MQRNFDISSIEDNIVWPRNREKNKKSELRVLVVGSDGRIRGGPIRTLIPKTTIKVYTYRASKFYIKKIEHV